MTKRNSGAIMLLLNLDHIKLNADNLHRFMKPIFFFFKKKIPQFGQLLSVRPSVLLFKLKHNYAIGVIYGLAKLKVGFVYNY